MKNFLRYLLIASALVVLLIGIFLPDTFSIIKKSNDDDDDDEPEEVSKPGTDTGIPYAQEVK